MSSPYEEQDFSNTQDLVKKRQRFLRRPSKAADVLSRLMARQGYAQVESQQELRAAWYSMVDERLKDRTQPGTVRAGVLEIIVSSSAVNQQLMFDKPKLLRELQQRWSTKIKDLRFKVGNVDRGSADNR